MSYDRDEDEDLRRDDYETRELNAGGVRAARIRAQHDEDERLAARIEYGRLAARS